MWTGSYQAPHGPPGAYTVTFTRDSAWHAKVEILSDGGAMPTAVRDVKVDASNVTWTQDLMGMTCKTTAVLAASALRGETACEQGALTFLLHKK